MEHRVTTARHTWPVGQRLARKDTEELGTVVEANRQIKVTWDRGRTSYFRHGQQANVQLSVADVEEARSIIEEMH